MYNKLYLGDCVQVLKSFPENSIDCVVSDPPYGLNFMGKMWDKALPRKEAFEQMNRVLKPGALAFIMSSPRQDVLWRVLRMLEESGFELKQSFVSWIFKSGFPKAYDVSKGIDKKFKKKRKVIGKYEHPQRKNRSYVNKADKNQHFNYDGKPEHIYDKLNLTEPATNLAKQWDGWKSITGLKPALECILMVNKPMSESTIVDNVLKWGTGAMNVDDCRIPYKSKEDFKFSHRENALEHKRDGNEQTVDYMPSYKVNPTSLKGNINIGRFPANLLVSDRAIDSGKITKSNVDKRDEESSTGKSGIYSKGWKRKPNMCNDIGDQSRYFDLDEWWNNRCIFFDVPKPSKRERNMGCEDLYYLKENTPIEIKQEIERFIIQFNLM